MNKILLIGKMNEVVKDLNVFLTKRFSVQVCSENAAVIEGMLDVVEPDLVLISLIGAMDIDPVIFNRLMTEHEGLPVLTIGTESERATFLKFYENDQFENLIRPIEHSTVLEAVCRRLALNLDDYRDVLLEEQEDGNRHKLLIVDDNASTLRAIKGMLEGEYDVMLANSGIKAMTAIGKRRPDLILLDYEMPVCDGKQTLEMIRADEDLSDIPVIFLTGVSDREHIEAVIELKPAGYLLKPPIKEKIVEAIEKTLT